MKVRWFGTYLFLLAQIPTFIWAQTLPDVLAGTSRVGLTSPSTPQLDASENENDTDGLPAAPGVKLGRLTVLPDDGRDLYFSAIDAANDQIRIEICVLEDPQILQHLQAALSRGVKVRAIVDRGKYSALDAEQRNLALYLTSGGGQLHLSNPVFPRSFPKIIIIDANLFVYPTSRISVKNLMISPVNSADQLVRLYQKAERTLDVYTELLGNLTLESELFAAVKRGVRVRLISPVEVNGATPEMQQLQTDSLQALAAAGVDVHVSGPEESAQLPYMHARAAVVDGKISYLGSISLSPNSITFNREMGLISHQPLLVRRLEAQFESDFRLRTKSFPGLGD